MNLLGGTILVAALVSPGWAAQAASLPEMRERTAEIAIRYLQVWSSNDAAAVQGVPYVYGPRVRFYGRDYTQGMLMDEKQRAIRQWPIRRYVHRPGTLKVMCNEGTQKCAARSTIDFQVENPARGTFKRGSARFDLGVSFEGPRPRILYEGGTTNRGSF
jgi:hypothetical protein